MVDTKEVLWLQEQVIALQNENIELKAITKFGGFKAGTFKGRKLERDRIAKNIRSRVSDLNACGKNDNCKELAELIESYIPEWIGR